MKADNRSAAFLLGPEGPLARAVPNYEVRDEQLAMTAAVEQALAAGERLMVEAGTGTGKSLAYLTPLIVWATRNRKRGIVVTHTIALQEQLVGKDLPLLQRHLGIDFRYALCIGSENYLCRRRFQRAEQQGLFTSEEDVEGYQRIAEWAAGARTGRRQEMQEGVPDAVWREVNRRPDLCLARRSPYFDSCFYQRARRAQESAQVLVANYHLFFSNIRAEGGVLAEHHAIIFDEAHTIEEVAGSFFGLELTIWRVNHLLNTVWNRRADRGLMTTLTGISRAARDAVAVACDEVSAAAEAQFHNLLALVPDRPPASLRLREPEVVANTLSEPCLRLADALEDISEQMPDEEQKCEVDACIGRSRQLADEVQVFTAQEEEDFVYWIETRLFRGQPHAIAHAEPIHVAEHLQRTVFDGSRPVVMTSATLAVGRKLDFLRQRTGVGECQQKIVGSPFDFRRQALVYVAADLPDPSRQRNEFEAAVLERVAELLDISGGRAFVLFTSYRAMRAAEQLREELPSLTFLVQGDMPTPALLERFSQDEESVLLGVNTFWEGVDVPGRALESVIITKLPFAVPNDPPVEARCEWVEAQGGNSFFDFQTPQAVIRLRQGVGRLIRTRTDRGLIAVLDPRVVTKRYGNLFLESLPSAPQTHSLDDVIDFFSRSPHAAPQPGNEN